MRSSISSVTLAMCSTNDPIVQNRSTVGAGGERDIPPARTQCFSKSTRDLLFRAVRKPWIAAIMASISWEVDEEGSG